MSDSSIVANERVPVASQDDVAQEWSDDIYDAANPDPIAVAIQAGQTAMLQAYQNAATYAALQSDPGRATDEYADECGAERGVFRRPNETDSAYRSRFFHQTTVDPTDIIAAANALLAPFTAKSCVYFEHSDCLFLRSDYLDVVDASNASPIVVKVRQPLPTTITNNSSVTVSLVLGNTAANGTWNVAIVMGPVLPLIIPYGITPPTITITGAPAVAQALQISINASGGVGVGTFSWEVGNQPGAGPQTIQSNVILPGTGLTVQFTAGTYTSGTAYLSVPIGLSLTGSTGNGTYTGSGSLLPALSDSNLHPTLWSGHIWSGTKFTTQNYPDRLYSNIPSRFSCGARLFSDATGRIFWLVAPDIGGIDNNVSPLNSLYLDIVDASNTTPIAITLRTPLPPSVGTGSTVAVTLVTGNNAANGGPFIATVTGANTLTLATQAGAPVAGSGTYTGGGSLWLPNNPLPATGFFLGGARNLPGTINLTGANSPQTMDATHTLALVNTVPTQGVQLNLPAAPTLNMLVAVQDISNYCSHFPFTVSGNGHNLTDPITGNVVASTLFRTDGIFAMWIWNGSQWNIYGLNATFLYSISATASLVYDGVVAAVEAIRGHSIRWGFLVDRRLN